MPEDERLTDGSYLSRVSAGNKTAETKSGGVTVRVIDYRLSGVPDTEPMDRLVTTIPDLAQASTQELAPSAGQPVKLCCSGLLRPVSR